MVIAKVVGTVVSTIKHSAYKDQKLLIVQPLHLRDQISDPAFLALDTVHAGVGDTVLVMREGNSAREITKIKDAPIISMIVGVLDSLTIEGMSA